MTQQYIVAFDAGGTRLKVVVVNLEGHIYKTFHTPSYANAGAEALFDAMVALLESLKQELNGELAGIGLSLSGVIHPDKGVVYLPGKFKQLEGYPLVAKLKEVFQVPVVADNDGRLAVYAEKYAGLAMDLSWVVGLTIGTGIGSGVILDGKLLTNRYLQFGVQVGHLIQNSSSNLFCLTGNYGTGETLCSATALVLQVRGAIQRGISSILSDDYFSDPVSIDFEKIVNACRNKDTLCLRELENWSNNLANLIVNAIHAYSPEMIILGGGCTLAADLFLDHVKRAVGKRVFRYPADEPVPIVISNMQEFGSALGAALNLQHRLKRDYKLVDE
ncbi:glucokinase [Chitinophaga polysaccharea]|uniref:Glucokinase n=1 Tax=Chitinophaga polysaccharea TaxID=1293035 RepID=A0A561PQH1_9BACT|nr:ROK family protein [Chitinophaga polysaccharea]TWF40367.1 glucokinase [Chitinophaga polysaccharea]